MASVRLIIDQSNRYALRTTYPTSIYFRVTVVGEAGPEDAPSPPTIVMLIDSSGSMLGSKLEAAKRAAINVIDSLPEGSYVAVYTFSTKVERLGACHVGDAACVESLKQAILKVEAEGSTAMYAALIKAIREFKRVGAGSAEAPMRLFLLTDGQPTDVTEHSRYIEIAKELRMLGIELMIIGLGEDYNESLLALMLEYARGVLEHVTDPEKIPDLMSRYAREASSVVVRGAVLRVTTDPRNKVEVYGRVQRILSNGVVVELGDLVEGEPVRVYGKVVVHPQFVVGEAKVAEVRVEAGGTVLAVGAVTVEFTDNLRLVREGSRPEISNEAMAVAGLISGNLEVAKTTLAYVGDASLKKTIAAAVAAGSAGDTKTLTSIKTKTLSGKLGE